MLKRFSPTDVDAKTMLRLNSVALSSQELILLSILINN